MGICDHEWLVLQASPCNGSSGGLQSVIAAGLSLGVELIELVACTGGVVMNLHDYLAMELSDRDGFACESALASAHSPKRGRVLSEDQFQVFLRQGC